MKFKKSNKLIRNKKRNFLSKKNNKFTKKTNKKGGFFSFFKNKGSLLKNQGNEIKPETNIKKEENLYNIEEINRVQGEKNYDNDFEIKKNAFEIANEAKQKFDNKLKSQEEQLQEEQKQEIYKNNKPNIRENINYNNYKATVADFGVKYKDDVSDYNDEDDDSYSINIKNMNRNQLDEDDVRYETALIETCKRNLDEDGQFILSQNGFDETQPPLNNTYFLLLHKKDGKPGNPVIDADGNRIYVNKSTPNLYKVKQLLRNGTFKDKPGLFKADFDENEPDDNKNCLYNVHPRNKKFYFFGGKTSKRKTSKRKTFKTKNFKTKKLKGK
jgi:hypothetical protein